MSTGWKRVGRVDTSFKTMWVERWHNEAEDLFSLAVMQLGERVHIVGSVNIPAENLQLVHDIELLLVDVLEAMQERVAWHAARHKNTEALRRKYEASKGALSTDPLNDEVDAAAEAYYLTLPNRGA